LLSSAFKDASGVVIPSELLDVSIGVGSLGVNQDLPGKAIGGLDTLPIQIRVQAKTAVAVQITSGDVYFSLINPGTCKYHPGANVNQLKALPYGSTQNIDTTATPNKPYYTFSAYVSTNTDIKTPFIVPVVRSDSIVRDIISLTTLATPWLDEKLGLTVFKLVLPKVNAFTVSKDNTAPFIVNVNAQGKYGKLIDTDYAQDNVFIV
jgi:hypothetical protein